MDAFIQQMNSRRGRVSRIAVGLAMVAMGVQIGGWRGWSLALAGLVPMVPAFWGHCA